MSLAITSFIIAALSLAVSILSFMTGSDKYRALRFAGGAALLFLTGIFTWIGVYSVTNQEPIQQIIVNNEATKPTPTNIVSPTATPNSFVECPKGDPLPHRPPVVGEPWNLPNGGWIIVNFWSNEPGIDQTEHKILLGPSDPRTFLGGGSAWQWPNGCEGDAQQNFQDNPLPQISLEELQAQGLVVQ